jgi:hypothetical protein
VAQTIGIGESVVIARRIVTEEMHDRRLALGLAPKNDIKNGTKAKILRAYTRPRAQDAVEIEIAADGSEVTVTGVAKGYGLVDVVDEISEPAGTDYEIYVVREPQQATAPAEIKPAAPIPGGQRRIAGLVTL